MKIKRLSVSQIAIPLKSQFTTAQLHRTTSSNIILRIEFDNGIWGYGEATPRTYVTGESPETVIRTINCEFVPVLKQADFMQLADIEEIVSELYIGLEDRTGLFNGSALCAVELALLDGLGKLLGKPLQYILGTPVSEEISFSLGLPYVDISAIPAYFQLISKYKPKHFKIKVGVSPADDLKRVNMIYRYFGDKVELRVDANCQWDLPTAITMAEKLENFGVVAIEQPLAKNDIAGLKQLKKATQIKIIVDESACSFNDVITLIDEDACDLVNIKISKCGGLINSLKIARYLYLKGKACILGAHVAETGILEAAGRVFGVLAQNVRYFEGSLSSFLFEEPVIEGVMEFDSHCLAGPSLEPGLGIALNEQPLSKFTLHEELMIDCT